jgi:hypothetical protein
MHTALSMGSGFIAAARVYGWSERNFECLDAARDIVLDFKDVRQVAVVAIGPEMRAGRGIDELRCNAHALASAAN